MHNKMGRESLRIIATLTRFAAAASTMLHALALLSSATVCARLRRQMPSKFLTAVILVGKVSPPDDSVSTAMAKTKVQTIRPVGVA